MSLFGKRKLAGSWRASAKADLRADRDTVLDQYAEVKDLIDYLITELDVAKIQCDEYILENGNA